MTWETLLRIFMFFGVFAVMAAIELWVPRRELKFGRGRRWITNFAIIGLDTLIVRIMMPTAVAGFALMAARNDVGAMNMLPITGLVAGIIGFLILDFTVWVAHIVSHKVPFFWSVHRLHHLDPDVDVTTAVRSHPFETLALLFVKIGVVVAFGIPALAVVVFELVTTALLMFNHANVRIPQPYDRYLRFVLITPDMHHIHHSVYEPETNSNYGFNFSVWDRLFGTYIHEPRGGYEKLETGLEEYQDERATGFLFALSAPFRDQAADREDMLRRRHEQERVAGE